MLKVDFFIVGQPKSGTTALAKFLSEHPKIGMSNPKEPGYFATDLRIESDKFHGSNKFFNIRTPRQYENIFKNVRDKEILGEASTNYLYSKAAAKNIFKHNPEAKIIILLRNPADFLHSLHMQYTNETKELIRDFRLALDAEPLRMRGQKVPKRIASPSYLFYMLQAQYYGQVKRYFDIFPHRNILVLITEEFQQDNAKSYQQVLDFLGASSFKPEFKIIHGSKAPRWKTLNYIFNNQGFKNLILKILGQDRYTVLSKRMAKLIMKRQQREKLDQQLRAQILGELDVDIKNLSKLIKRDLKRLWRFE